MIGINAIFTPVVIGLVILGWYALRGGYSRLPARREGL
jgi:hypothetical protein